MKMTTEHYIELKNAIRPLYKQFPRHYLPAKWTVNMYAWELFHKANYAGNWFCSKFYEYLNDTHIETAINQIVKELDQEPSCYSIKPFYNTLNQERN